LSYILNKFILQAKAGDLKTSGYPKDFNGLTLKISFGMGALAKVPWIAFLAQNMKVSNGIYPCYLYYKEKDLLILAYGISETNDSEISWPVEVINSAKTIASYLNEEVPRYGNSFVFKAYRIEKKENKISFIYVDSDKEATKIDLESDLNSLLNYYYKVLSIPQNIEKSTSPFKTFTLEDELEDFLIRNWDKTELGKKYSLIIEDGELKSQQYKTDVGSIDILVKDKNKGNYVVIELKRNQTSDDTVGQVLRYMGWVSQKLGDNNVKGLIIAGQYDKKLDYALKMIKNVDVILYEIDFKFKDFKGDINKIKSI